MSAVALPRFPASGNPSSIGLVGLLRATFAAIDEGLELAERYRQLAQKTDTELASLGLERRDVARFVYFGNAA